MFSLDGDINSFSTQTAQEAGENYPKGKTKINLRIRKGNHTIYELTPEEQALNGGVAEQSRFVTTEVPIEGYFIVNEIFSEADVEQILANLICSTATRLSSKPLDYWTALNA